MSPQDDGERARGEVRRDYSLALQATCGNWVAGSNSHPWTSCIRLETALCGLPRLVSFCSEFRARKKMACRARETRANGTASWQQVGVTGQRVTGALAIANGRGSHALILIPRPPPRFVCRRPTDRLGAFWRRHASARGRRDCAKPGAAPPTTREAEAPGRWLELYKRFPIGRPGRVEGGRPCGGFSGIRPCLVHKRRDHCIRSRGRT